MASPNPVAVAAKAYVSAGLRVIQWRGEKSKGPREEGWNRPESAISKPQQVLADDHGIGLAHLYSRTMALDVDNLHLACEYFKKHAIDLVALLSSGVRISSGREGRAKLIYYIPEDIKPADLLTINDQANGFELRCATRGGLTVQDVLPPTIHPVTSKPYVWAGPDDQPDPWRRIPVAPLLLLEHWWSRLNEFQSTGVTGPCDHAVVPIVKDALAALDPDADYKTWIDIGMALHSAGLGDQWDAWSQGGAKYQRDDCEARIRGFRPDGGITLGTLFLYARQAGWDSSEAWSAAIAKLVTERPEYRSMLRTLKALRGACQPTGGEWGSALKKLKPAFGGTPVRTLQADFDAIDADQHEADGKGRTFTDHLEIAVDYVERRYKAAGGDSARVVANGHSLLYWDQYWRAEAHAQLVKNVQSDYSDQPLCRYHSQVKQAADAILTHLYAPDFFADAPVGIATPGGFYFIRDGVVCREDNAPEHRQLAFTPVKPAAGEMPLFMANLRRFLGDDPGQLDLAQEVAGAVLFRQMYRYKQAVILYGPSRAGKSTFAHVLVQMFTEDTVVHMAPNQMDQDYYRANLAGAALNTFMELPDAKDIGSNFFKMIVEGERCGARQIRQQVVTLQCRASHVFSTNYIPTTTLTDDSWYNRFRVLEFRNPLSDEELNYNFEQELTAELPAIMHWAIEGQRRLLKQGRFTETASHDRFMARWRRANNQVLQFLSDSAWVTWGEGKTIRRSEAYNVYVAWCRCYDRQVIQKSKFNAEMANHFTLKDVGADGHKWEGVVMSVPKADKAGPAW